MNEIKVKINEYAIQINNGLNLLVPEMENAQRKIYETMRYSLLNGGKRVRPILALATNEMLGGKLQDVLPFACAIEMIHTYSLIHDDLPAMDNDDLRRGIPTNHKVYGDGIAVLAGDALLNKAYETMISTLSDGVNIYNKIKAFKVIANASGTEGMIGGQIIDLESEDKEISYEHLKNMHALKTGMLVSASALTGAIMAGASEDEANKICTYASNLGLAFQIKDDILSEVGESEKMGKKTGNDRERKKSTYVTILGLEESEKLLKKVTNNAVQGLDGFGDNASFLRQFAEYLLNREN